MRISLTALRAFEATARLSSMSAASAELRVGLASISRHVSALQARMGVELLRREGRGVMLTPAGRAYFAEITAAFHSINSATTRIASDSAPRGPRMGIICDRSFAQRWLLPRLAGFSAEVAGLSLTLVEPREAWEAGFHPDITLSWRRLEAAIGPEDVVLAEPPLHAMAARDAPPVASISALLRAHPLIHAGTRDLWRDWLAMAGHVGELPGGSLVVPDKAMALTASARGLGVALACTLLAEPELEAGHCQPILSDGIVLGRYVATRHHGPGVDVALANRFIGWIEARMREASAVRLAARLIPA